MDTEKLRREVHERMELLDSTVLLNLINGETRTIKIRDSKGLKQMRDKSTGNVYSRIYLRKTDKESGHRYLDVADPCVQDLIDLLSPSLESLQLNQITLR